MDAKPLLLQILDLEPDQPDIQEAIKQLQGFVGRLLFTAKARRCA